MNLSEAEKRMIYQVEGTSQGAALNEIYMTWRYAPDKAMKDTAEGLLKKLRPLSDKECMDVIRDVQKNYRLPGKARTIGEMLAEARQQSGAQKMTGHDIMDNEDDFQRFEVQAYRSSELVRLGLEFASDQSFAIEDYVIGKMARCFGTSEEQAFINGTGENQPTGILHATDGAETGVTAESDSAISYDEIIKLYLSVDKKYRKHGTWLMNDETALALRTLKDSVGNYLWKESNETIFSKPVQIVDSMPSIGKGQKVIAFGDFSNYWLVQRFPMTIRTLKEKFAVR